MSPGHCAGAREVVRALAPPRPISETLTNTWFWLAIANAAHLAGHHEADKDLLPMQGVHG